MLADKLLSERKRKNYTQQRVADYLGITRPAYTAYERGTRQPDYETLKKLSDLYDVSIDYLLGRESGRELVSEYLEIQKKRLEDKLNEKDEKDIAKRMAKMKKDLLEANADGDGLNYMGEPMSAEAIESLLEALEHAERIATLANKKYAPNKYKKKE